MTKSSLISAAAASLLASWSVAWFAGTAACAQDIPTIRVGWTIPAEEAKYWMMRRPEAFPNLGKTYKIEWTQFQGTAPMVQAMVAGALDCSTQGVLSLAQGAAQANLKAYVVAQHVGEKPGSFSVYWAVKDDSPIKTIEDMKGKSVGTNVFGSGILGPMMLLLKRHGLDPERDIKLVETGFPGSEDAIRGGRIDVGVLNQPFAARAEAKGGLRKLFALSDQEQNIVHIMEVCRKDFVDAHPELARQYVRDLTAGMRKAVANRDETLKVDSEVTKAPVAVLDTFLLKPNDFAREPGAKPNFAAIQAMLDIYAQTGMVTQKLDVANFKHPTIVAPIE
ncbi:MAG TPA: ABC transporter substrate-binding protein [Xanthobacteraceae bacterium]